jgi:hypothetical protein
MPVPTIATYVSNPTQALIDAASDPVFREFVLADDVQLTTVDMGDGTQAQVQALSKGGAAKVVRRIVERLEKAGERVKDSICSPNHFNLCGKLKTTTPGQLMQDFNTFFSNKWTERGVTVAHVCTLIPALALHPLAPFLVTFSALGLLNGAFVELCDCP